MTTTPKITASIHFLNAEKYLNQSISSIFRQTFTDWELLLVDGGSNDRSFEIATSYEEQRPQQVRVLQHRGEKPIGIFSSRIWGAEESRASILAQLDADDEWHPQYLERQYGIYQAMFGDAPGMVCCPMVYWWDDISLAAKSFVQPFQPPGLHQPPDLVLKFIQEGYQRTPGDSSAIVSRRVLLDAAELASVADGTPAEDQYFWSFVALRYPVFVNPEPLVRYRQQSDSFCAKTTDMSIHRAAHLRWLLDHLQQHNQYDNHEVLSRQIRQVLVVENLNGDGDTKNSEQDGYSPRPVGNQRRVQNLLQGVLPTGIYKALGASYRRVKQLPAPVVAHVQQFRSRARLTVGLSPLSDRWGYDRGLPLHQYYVEQFLREHSADIRGRCLEFQDDSYTSRFAGGVITKLDLLHVDDSNPRATIVGDLTGENDFPSDAFDCIICTHVLHVIYEFDRAIAELHRMLKPGGVLLVAVPKVSMCEPDEGELWRFTAEGLRQVLAKHFGNDNTTIQAYGNSLTSAGYLRGLVTSEFQQRELDYTDLRFATEICGRAVKH